MQDERFFREMLGDENFAKLEAFIEAVAEMADDVARQLEPGSMVLSLEVTIGIAGEEHPLMVGRHTHLLSKEEARGLALAPGGEAQAITAALGEVYACIARQLPTALERGAHELGAWGPHDN